MPMKKQAKKKVQEQQLEGLMDDEKWYADQCDKKFISKDGDRLITVRWHWGQGWEAVLPGSLYFKTAQDAKSWADNNL